MRNKIFIAVIVAFVTNSPLAQQTENIKVGSTTRTFIRYTPSGLPDNPALIISMHGLGGSGSFQRTMYSLDNLADKDKFIVVYPDGIYKVSGSNGWDISGTSDVDFISAIIDSMAGRCKIDSNRVFATGFSMGGMMSYKLACTITDKIAAIAPASGYPMSIFGYNDTCTPTAPVPICHFHGTADNVVSYSGLETFVENFVKSNGCTEAPITTNPTSKIKKEQWELCGKGSEIVIYHFNGMGHAYPTVASQGFSPNDTLWNFFKRHPRNSAVKTIKPISGAHFKNSVSVTYSEGIIHMQGVEHMHAVRVIDIQGKEVLTWKSATNPVTSLVFPVNKSAGIFIVNIVGLNGNTALKVVVR